MVVWSSSPGSNPERSRPDREGVRGAGPRPRRHAHRLLGLPARRIRRLRRGQRRAVPCSSGPCSWRWSSLLLAGWRRAVVGSARHGGVGGAAFVVLDFGSDVNLLVVAGLMLGLTAVVHDAVYEWKPWPPVARAAGGRCPQRVVAAVSTPSRLPRASPCTRAGHGRGRGAVVVLAERVARSCRRSRSTCWRRRVDGVRPRGADRRCPPCC